MGAVVPGLVACCINFTLVFRGETFPVFRGETDDDGECTGADAGNAGGVVIVVGDVGVDVAGADFFAGDVLLKDFFFVWEECLRWGKFSGGGESMSTEREIFLSRPFDFG